MHPHFHLSYAILLRNYEERYDYAVSNIAMLLSGLRYKKRKSIH